MDVRFMEYCWLTLALCCAMNAQTPLARPNETATKSKRMAQMVVRQENVVPGAFLENLRSNEIRTEDISVQTSIESKTKAIKELLGVLGLKAPENLANIALREKAKKPPKYMVDLYNAIADDNGITRTPGLLEADTVRSIPNIDSKGPKFCKFDLSAITDEDIILDAELHLFQSQKTFRSPNRATIPLSNRHHNRLPVTYLVKIYQLLSDAESDSPVKRLVSARRLYSYHSGWHIFPILSTVEEWLLSKENNHGLMTEMTSESGEVIENILERESLQPILVLFTNNSKTVTGKQNETVTKDTDNSNQNSISQTRQIPGNEQTTTENQHARKRRAAYSSSPKARKKNSENKKSRRNRNKNRDGTHEDEGDSEQQDSDDEDQSTSDTEYVYMYGATENGEQDRTRQFSRGGGYHSDEDNSQFYQTDDFDYASDSADKTRRKESTQGNPSGPNSHKKTSFLPFTSFPNTGSEVRTCGRYPLYVDFEEMGWSGWIIHPQGYNAYHCQGQCSFPLGQNLNPSNHATVQSIMHTLGLGNQPVEMPCCAPDKLYDINLLYFDQNDYVVLRRYKDMVAASCACR